MAYEIFLEEKDDFPYGYAENLISDLLTGYRESLLSIVCAFYVTIF